MTKKPFECVRRVTQFMIVGLTVGLVVACSESSGQSTGSSSSSVSSTSDQSVAELQAKVDDLEEDITKLKESLEEAKTAVDEVRSSYDDLELAMNGFSSGEDWSEVVPTVRSRASDVDGAISSAEAVDYDPVL